MRAGKPFKKQIMFFSVPAVFFLILISNALALPIGTGELEVMMMGSEQILDNAPDYQWWYGCTPTAAGMLMGYYDINGYGGLSYNNLVPGISAYLSNYSIESSEDPVRNIVASEGHVDDFWVAMGSNDSDPWRSNLPPQLSHEFNCLADFMGTSQDFLGYKKDGSPVGNSDGCTRIWNSDDGSKLTAEMAVLEGIENMSGMYGIGEYLNYCGYGWEEGSLFNQYTDNRFDGEGGFTFDEYKNEIDFGRPVVVHLEGHSVFSFGYDDTTQTIYLHDTWNVSAYEGAQSMLWGDFYDGLAMQAVTCLTLSGGAIVPEPETWILFIIGALAMMNIKKKVLAKTKKRVIYG
ncbi:MAG: C39 family peptidase [Candidatus Omnitrophica bacterium]|nr:C39 family peptidase [Candidatus Omnitrophota bacterium]